MAEVLDSAHLTYFVNSPFRQRGMLCLAGPPGVLKSSIIQKVFNFYPQALVLGDLNVRSLSLLYEDFVGGRYTTLCLEEFAKLYARKTDSSSNMETTIAALVDQGFGHPSFRDQRAICMEARALVVAAMTMTFYYEHITHWQESGLARRCIFLSYRFNDFRLIGDYIERGEQMPLDGIRRMWPKTDSIPFDINEHERAFVRKLIRDQADEKTPQILAQKIFAVLKWKNGGDGKEATRIFEELEPLLSKNGGYLEPND